MLRIRKEGLGCRFSGKASFAELQQEIQADLTVQSAGTTKKDGIGNENPSENPSQSRLKHSAVVKTRSTLEGLKVT